MDVQAFDSQRAGVFEHTAFQTSQRIWFTNYESSTVQHGWYQYW